MALVGAVAVCMIAGGCEQCDGSRREPAKGIEKSNDSNSLVIGIVTVVKDNDGNITEIKVTAHRETHIQSSSR